MFTVYTHLMVLTTMSKTTDKVMIGLSIGKVIHYRLLPVLLDIIHVDTNLKSSFNKCNTFIALYN